MKLVGYADTLGVRRVRVRGWGLGWVRMFSVRVRNKVKVSVKVAVRIRVMLAHLGFEWLGLGLRLD